MANNHIAGVAENFKTLIHLLILFDQTLNLNKSLLIIHKQLDELFMFIFYRDGVIFDKACIH